MLCPRPHSSRVSQGGKQAANNGLCSSPPDCVPTTPHPVLTLRVCLCLETQPHPFEKGWQGSEPPFLPVPVSWKLPSSQAAGRQSLSLFLSHLEECLDS